MDVTREDLREMRDELRLQIADGFGGINVRLDALNGRVRKGEEADARHDERLKVVEREMGWCRREFERVGKEIRAVYEEVKTATATEIEAIRELLIARASHTDDEGEGGIVTNRKLTQRDVWLVGLGVALGVAVFKLLVAAGPQIAAAVQSVGK